MSAALPDPNNVAGKKSNFTPYYPSGPKTVLTEVAKTQLTTSPDSLVTLPAYSPRNKSMDNGGKSFGSPELARRLSVIAAQNNNNAAQQQQQQQQQQQRQQQQQPTRDQPASLNATPDTSPAKAKSSSSSRHLSGKLGSHDAETDDVGNTSLLSSYVASRGSGSPHSDSDAQSAQTIPTPTTMPLEEDAVQQLRSPFNPNLSKVLRPYMLSRARSTPNLTILPSLSLEKNPADTAQNQGTPMGQGLLVSYLGSHAAASNTFDSQTSQNTSTTTPAENQQQQQQQSPPATLTSSKSTAALRGSCGDDLDQPGHAQQQQQPQVMSGAVTGLGLFASTTRRFGNWLVGATDGQKVDISRKDLNAFAPTTF